MELALFVYLASVFNSINIIAFFLSICFLLLTLISWIYIEDKALGMKHPKFYIIGLGISLFILAIVPSERTMYMMAGAYTTQNIATSETGQKVYKLVNKKLDEYLVETENKLTK